MSNKTVEGTAPLLFKGSNLPMNGAERIDFAVFVPEGYWESYTGALEVSVTTDHRDKSWPILEVFTIDGSSLGRGEEVLLSQVVLIDQALSGKYFALIKQGIGKGDYEGVIQIDAKPKSGPVADLLPNIVTLPPTELNLYFGGECIVGCLPVTVPGNPPGCQTLERVEHQVERCLRFTNRIGNAGEGVFQILLPPDEGAKAMAGQGRWTQRVYRTDGSFYDNQAGNAAYHATHQHTHYQGMASFQLYMYDLASKSRGEAVGEGRKTGFYFTDSGLVTLGLPGTAEARTCNALMANDVAKEVEGSCLSPNWFDLYPYGLPDQYLDIGNIPDGTYELISISNMGGTVIESNSDDNEASVVFQLKGNAIEEVGIN